MKKDRLKLSNSRVELDEEFASLFNPAIPKEELKFDKLKSLMAVLPAAPTVDLAQVCKRSRGRRCRGGRSRSHAAAGEGVGEEEDQDHDLSEQEDAQQDHDADTSNSSGDAAKIRRGRGLDPLAHSRFNKDMYKAGWQALQDTSLGEKRKIVGHLAPIARLITAKTGYVFDYNEFNMPSGFWPSSTPASHVFDAVFYSSTNAIFQCDFGYVISGWGTRG